MRLGGGKPIFRGRPWGVLGRTSSFSSSSPPALRDDDPGPSGVTFRTTPPEPRGGERMEASSNRSGGIVANVHWAAMRPQTLGCRIGAGLSTSASAGDAARAAAREVRGGPVGGAEVDLAFLFLSPAHLDGAEAAGEAVREELAPRHLLGCVAEGVLAGGRELEQGPGAAVWAGALPGAEIECFHVAAVQTRDGIAVAGLPELDDPTLVALLVDPFTFPVGQFLTRLNERHERIPLVGGIAAGGRERGAQALILDDAVHAEGAVGAVVSGVPVVTVVSQGCRPIGREAVITRCEGNLVYELAGKPALERLLGQIAALSSERQALGGALRRGRPVGALLFTCNGRGTNMFPEPDHDARRVAEALATQATAGFFCGGEIGPVGGKAFLHGFTATLAVFLEP